MRLSSDHDIEKARKVLAGGKPGRRRKNMRSKVAPLLIPRLALTGQLELHPGGAPVLIGHTEVEQWTSARLFLWATRRGLHGPGYGPRGYAQW